MWLGWFGLLGWSGWYYVLELVRVAGKVWLGWLWQSGSSRWSGRTGKSKGQGVLDSLLPSFSSLKSQFVLSFQKIFWPRRPPWLWVDLGLFLCPKKFRPQQLLIFLKFMLPFWNFVKFLKCCIQFYILWNFWNFYPVLKICRNLVNIWNFVPCFEILWNFWNFVPRFEIFVKYLEQTSVLRGPGWSKAQGTVGQKAMVEELGI